MAASESLPQSVTKFADTEFKKWGGENDGQLLRHVASLLDQTFGVSVIPIQARYVNGRDSHFLGIEIELKNIRYVILEGWAKVQVLYRDGHKCDCPYMVPDELIKFLQTHAGEPGEVYYRWDVRDAAGFDLFG